MSSPAAIAITKAEIALLTTAGWTPEAEDKLNRGVSDLAYRTYWGSVGIPCACCGLGVDAILTKFKDGKVIGSAHGRSPWAETQTVKQALEIFQTATYFPK